MAYRLEVRQPFSLQRPHSQAPLTPNSGLRILPHPGQQTSCPLTAGQWAGFQPYAIASSEEPGQGPPGGGTGEDATFTAASAITLFLLTPVASVENEGVEPWPASRVGIPVHAWLTGSVAPLGGASRSQ